MFLKHFQHVKYMFRLRWRLEVVGLLTAVGITSHFLPWWILKSSYGQAGKSIREYFILDHSVQISVNTHGLRIFVVGFLLERLSCKYDLVESLPRIQTLTQSTPVSRASFGIRITAIEICIMTSVYCASPFQSSTLTPSFQYVCRHPPSTLTSSKSAWSLASDEHLTLVCFINVSFYNCRVIYY